MFRPDITEHLLKSLPVITPENIIPETDRPELTAPACLLSMIVKSYLKYLRNSLSLSVTITFFPSVIELLYASMLLRKSNSSGFFE